MTYHYRAKIIRGMPYWVVVLVVLVVAGASLGTASILGRREPQHDPAATVPSDDARTVAIAVGKLIRVPSNETPVLITVKDKQKTKGLPLMDQAENGDQLLVYQKAKKAYLYRSATNQLVTSGHMALE